MASSSGTYATLKASASNDTSDFGERIHQAEEAAFVGRADLLAKLADFVAEADTEPRFVAVVGPGGAGKTTLLRQLLRRVSRLREQRTVWLSGERIAPNVGAFEAAVAEHIDGGLGALGRSDVADVLVIDGYEKLRAIERWLLDDALPRAGARLCVLVTTREHFASRVRPFAGLGSLTREVVVPPFTDAEAGDYLNRRGVPEEAHADVIDYAAGHALALSLVTEKFALNPDWRFHPDDAHDLIATLAYEFLRDAPSIHHEDALYALALPPTLDEALLGAMLGEGESRAHEIFRWLEKLTFVERGDGGLVPHPLVRNALYDDLALRDMPRLQRLVARASDAILHHGGPPLRGHERMMRALYMHRKTAPHLRAFRFDRVPYTYCRPCTPATAHTFADVVERWEGTDSRDRFLAAFAHDPELFHGVYGENAELLALFAFVTIRSLPALIRQGDPILEAAFSIWRELEPDAKWDLAVGRWWMTSAGYHAHGPDMQALVTGGPFVTALRAPDVRHVICATSPPEAWEPLAPAFGLEVVRRVTLGERMFTLVHADVHALVGACAPSETAARLARLHYRRLASLGGDDTPDERSIDYDAFVVALRSALPLLRRPRELERSLLLETRVAGRGGASGIAAAIEGACATLVTQGYAESARVIRATYLGAAPKQEAAAAELNLPFGTYRHHLRRAIDDLAVAMWAEEKRIEPLLAVGGIR